MKMLKLCAIKFYFGICVPVQGLMSEILITGITYKYAVQICCMTVLEHSLLVFYMWLLWCVLTGLATQLLTEVFSSSFLTPLEETDTCFQLEVGIFICCHKTWFISGVISAFL